MTKRKNRAIIISTTKKCSCQGYRAGAGRNEKEEFSYEENVIFGSGGSHDSIPAHRLRPAHRQIPRQKRQRTQKPHPKDLKGLLLKE